MRGHCLKVCQWCGEVFETFNSVVEAGGGRFCDRVCTGKYSAKVRWEKVAEQKRRVKDGSAEVDRGSKRKA